MIKVDPAVEKAWLRYNRRLRQIVLGPNYRGPIFQIKKQLLIQLGLEVEIILAKKKWPTFGELKPKKFLPPSHQEVVIRELLDAVRANLPSPVSPVNLETLQTDFVPGYEYGDGLWVAKHSFVDPSACLLPPVVIGKDCYVGPEVILGGVCLRQTAIKPNQDPNPHHFIPTVILKSFLGFSEN